jgi:hypothetical protein
MEWNIHSPRIMRLLILGFLLSVLLLTDAALAQGTSADTAFHPNVKPSLEVKRRVGEITIDGDLSDEGWKNAASADGFCNSFPVYGAKPPEKTSAKITYDDNYLYIAMIAQDSDTKSIRASHATRDHVYSDDFMGIILDTYGDGSRAFEIYCNPYGIQNDLFWTSSNEDDSYDIVFESEAKITETGWQTEMKIPFRSLRFPDIPVQNFHCTFWRSMPRDQIWKSSWAAINFYAPCPFCQFGTLTGIEHVHPAGSFELLPSVVASQDAKSPDGGPLVNENVQFKPSLGVRYALSTATGLELALNPDFSQVESDAAQISANTTFALYYPEHRPFFQDGADLYNMNINAIYTRTINTPIVAAKAIHRDDALSVIYTGAVDEHSPVIIPLEERSIVLGDAGKSISNIARATYSFGNDTKIGGLLTNRTFGSDGSNTVTGIDARVHLFENVEMSGQGLFSYTQEPHITKNGDTSHFDNGKYSVEYDGEHFLGSAAHLSLSRVTSGLDMEFIYDELSPTFRAANGFIFQNDYSSFVGYIAEKLFSHGASWYSKIYGNAAVQLIRNFEGQTKTMFAKVELGAVLAAQTGFDLTLQHAKQLYRGVEFPNINFATLIATSNSFSWADLGVTLGYGSNFSRNTDIPTLGKELDLNINAAFRLPIGIAIAPQYSYSRLDSMNGSGSFYNGAIYRLTVSGQFTRELSVRLIVQYDGFAKALEIDPLLTYQVNPFTSLYVGSSHNYNSFDTTNTLRPSERQLFAKIQYLFQG